MGIRHGKPMKSKIWTDALTIPTIFSHISLTSNGNFSPSINVSSYKDKTAPTYPRKPAKRAVELLRDITTCPGNNETQFSELTTFRKSWCDREGGVADSWLLDCREPGYTHWIARSHIFRGRCNADEICFDRTRNGSSDQGTAQCTPKSWNRIRASTFEEGPRRASLVRLHVEGSPTACIGQIVQVVLTKDGTGDDALEYAMDLTITAKDDNGITLEYGTAADTAEFTYHGWPMGTTHLDVNVIWVRRIRNAYINVHSWFEEANT